MFWFSSFRSRFIISEKRPFSARNWINLIPDIYPRDKKRIDLERKILYENGFDGHTDGCLLQYASVQKPKSTKVHSKSFGPMPAAGAAGEIPGRGLLWRPKKFPRRCGMAGAERASERGTVRRLRGIGASAVVPDEPDHGRRGFVASGGPPPSALPLPFGHGFPPAAAPYGSIPSHRREKSARTPIVRTLCKGLSGRDCAAERRLTQRLSGNPP